MRNSMEYKYGIEYEPRVEDPVIIRKFESLEEAEAYMEIIQDKRPRASLFHKIIPLDREPINS
tara:strand:- start:303 stop:491 length:189 start_codon:yes stop_codon:yes gene_type:complete